ncbi:Piso0_000784 [Millerozyma farinosa CBS 7064]|uniref:Piso0_000784 protein n=1 Tax=Pichia sorbitophila (strain ATCC MYA-4447 / BCRC 22081 / CBS 7064 / NBRC 10061 / NRRL Y-12695) TaxID=559304 RepID=G8YRI1_PICSO|nr:Piso0_000784 [Millerozyma farinosa CBS 7064]
MSSIITEPLVSKIMAKKTASKETAKDIKSKAEAESDALELPSSSAEESQSDDGEEESASDDSDSDSDIEVEIEGDSDSETEESSADAKATKSKHTVVANTPSNKKTANKNKNKPGVIYIGRLPEGFQEHEMKKYFRQFGDITRLRLSRNKKTGKSKHYGFIEFQHYDVAKIAAETMNNYLLFGHLLRVHSIENENIHDDLFKGSASRFKVVPRQKISKHLHDKAKPKETWDKLTSKYEKKKALKRKQLSQKGFDFDLENI